jgi:glycosyltransferase involved in cell wall biosynthesis
LNLVIWFCKNAKKFDLVHLHLSRDFVTTIIGLISTFMMIPIIVQSHGMVAEGKSVPKRVFDLMLSKRIMHKARKIYVLSDAEFRKTISRYGIKSSMISQIQNGALNTSSILNRTSHNHTVVWIGRLQRHKRPELFVEIAKSAANIFKELVFIIVGPDGGVKHKVLDSINRMNLTNIKVLEPLNNDEVYALLSSSAILINTSISELNPMVVVEALSVGTPVIINDACEAKGMIANSRSGMVIKGHPDEYIKAIDVVLKDWFQYSENARELFLNSLTIDAVAAKISKDYVFIASNKIGKH